MNIQILNNNLTPSGQVTGYSLYEFTRAWNTIGNFKITINKNQPTAKYLAVDKIAYFDADKIGYIKRITLDQKDNKANEILVVEGVELKDELRRLTYPPTGESTDSYIDEYIETIIKSLLRKNAGAEVLNGTRRIPGLITAGDNQKGSQINFSTRYKSLPSEIYKLLKVDQLGLKCTLDLLAKQIIYDVVSGVDHTAVVGGSSGIVLSISLNTATAVKRTIDKQSFANVSITAGQGEGAARTIVEVGDTAQSGYNRSEIFTDARDISSDDELTERGNQKLANTSLINGKEIKYNQFGPRKIDQDFALGDYVSTEIDGEYENAQLVKVTYKNNTTNIPEVFIVLDFDINDTLINDIKTKNDNYDNIVAAQ